jgi:hypothetical protein
MNDLTRILSAIGGGDPQAAEQLLPLVYDELRKLAAVRLAQVRPTWDSRGHFFAAAAEAMRRILAETARRKKRQKRGGNRRRVVLDDQAIAAPIEDDRLLELDAALEKLQAAHSRPGT